MNNVTKLAQLALESGIEGLDKWDEGRLEEWLAWMDASGCIMACYPDQQSMDNPCGFAVVRPLRSLANKHQNYRIDENGEILFCDMAVAPTRNIVRSIGLGIIQRYGVRQYFVNDRKGKTHIHNWASIGKALFKKH